MGKGKNEQPAVLPSVYVVADQEVAAASKGLEQLQNKVYPDRKKEKEGSTLDDDAEKEAREKQKRRRDREPLLYCKLVARWPLQSFLLTLAGQIMAVIISVALLASGYDLLPVDFENLPLEINDQPWRPRDLAWRQRNQFTGYYNREPLAGYRVNSYFRANIDLYYDAEGGNIFTKSNLQMIQHIENTLMSVPEYNNTYCQLNVNMTSCERTTSVIRYFDGSLSSIDATFNDPTFDNIASVLYTAYTNNATKGQFQFFLGKSHSITPTNAYSSITRSILPIGYPLQGYTNTDSYEKHIRKFSADKMKPLLVDFREDVSSFDFSYRSDLLWTEDVFNQAMKDVLCAFGSICFIFVFILIHTKSLWITGFAILSIITSFLYANLLYRIVFDYRYIGFFHILTLFIILGIGADDIFVFYDVWRNTAYEEYKTLAHRLSDSYRKSVFSMLFTSVTTAVAFFASAISPLLATRSFGVFSGLVIIVNYLSVILYFPTVVVMYHTKFEKFKWPCIKCGKKLCADKCMSNSKDYDENEGSNVSGKCNGTDVHNTKFKVDNTNALFKMTTQNGVPRPPSRSSTNISVKRDGEKITTQISIDRSQEPIEKNAAVYDVSNGVINGGFELEAESPAHTQSKPASSHGQEYYGRAKKRKRKSMMVNFFGTKYFAFVTHRYLRWVILAVEFAVLIFFAVNAAKLEPDNEGLKVLKNSHVYSIARDHGLGSFVASDTDRTVELYIVWGMAQNDMSDCHFSTPKCAGRQVWDPNFNPSSQAAQIAVQNFCDKLNNFSPQQANDFRLKTNFATGQYQINCYINNLGDFLDAESVSTGSNWSLTYDYARAVSFMDDRTTYYDSSNFSSAYDHFLEIPISYWLSNRYTFDRTIDFFLFDHLIGEEQGTYSTALKTDSSKLYGNNIKYIGIQVNTTIRLQSIGYSEGIPIMNRWEDFVNTEMANMPDGMKGGFQLTRMLWHWLLVQEMLAKNAVYGIVIGVCVAFPILIIATGNIITGSLATFSMCCSTVCVIGLIPLGGWKLGVLESLNMCMVVGLTVDYVVHLAEGYTLSLHRDRKSRVRDMLDEMAVSVFFGACTTLGASLFMFIAQLSFFLQFGIFMFSTIGFSLFFSMGMFVTLMGLIGPQNDTGRILPYLKRLRAFCKRSSSSRSEQATT